MSESGERIAELKLRYCPPLDDATLLAILSDYDLTSESEIKNASQVLDMVAESVEAEESTGFDPSGSSGAPLTDYDADLVAQDQSEDQSTVTWSSTTDDTSLSHGMSVLDLEGAELGAASLQHPQDKIAMSLADAYNAELDGMDLAAKETMLVETFPGLKPFDIHWTLTKCKGDASQAIEELLNQVFLEENGSRRRGVEGFSESNIPTLKKKGRNRRNRQEQSIQSLPSSGGDVSVEAESKWQSARRDVETISALTGMPSQQVSSLYHKHGALVSSTINAIVDAHQALEIDDDDSSIYLQASELGRDFPAIPITRLIAIVQLCDSAESSSRDLIKALTSRPPTSRTESPIRLEFRLPPPDLSEGPSETKAKPKLHNSVYLSCQGTQQVPSYTSNGKDYKVLRNEAFDQASAAYRKSKSDRLMGGAAAYYSSLGRDFDASAKSAAAAAADAIAMRQSTAFQLDLHGISVVDAVRIAREKVTSWWVALGDRSSGYGGYKIITGKGTHSEGGIARIGPAVGRMLIREGWRVVIGSGSLVVTGVAREGKRF